MTERSVGADNSAKWGALRNAPQLSRLYLDALRGADTAWAFRVASSGLAQGMTTPELYQRVVAPAMHEIGALWEKGALTVADEHLATALTHRVLAALRAPVGGEASGSRREGGGSRPRLMLAAVEGEEHALGLRMAADIGEDAGFDSIYLGADVPTNALLQAISSLSPDLLALGVTMPHLAPRLEEVCAAVRQAHPQVGLLAGGQAASPEAAAGALVEDLEALPSRLASAAASLGAGRSPENLP
ncbi:MAG TPA: cobalamin-dependent protein [Solirubrobacterales bacterium]|nr:cobalamin-dependent protein [Solirubrobacterales bacterium]